MSFKKLDFVLSLALFSVLLTIQLAKAQITSTEAQFTGTKAEYTGNGILSTETQPTITQSSSTEAQPSSTSTESPYNEKRRYCGYSLAFAIGFICNDLREPSFTTNSSESTGIKNHVISKRYTSSGPHICCRVGCSFTDLREYCTD